MEIINKGFFGQSVTRINSVEECKAYIEKRRDSAEKQIRGSIIPDGTATAITLPEDTDPWAIIYAIVNQFYQREQETAWAHYESKATKRDLEKVKERYNMHVDEVQGVKFEYISWVKDLLTERSSEEWRSGIEETMDLLITLGVNYKEFNDAVLEALDFTRDLKTVFKKLIEATDKE